MDWDKIITPETVKTAIKASAVVAVIYILYGKPPHR